LIVADNLDTQEPPWTVAEVEYLHTNPEAVMKRLLSILAGSATIAMLASSANAAVVARNCGSLPQVNTVHSTNSQTGTSNVFAPVAGSLVNFTVAGTVNSCVIVSFSAQAYAPKAGLIWVRAKRDGFPSVDGQIAFAAEDGAFAQARSYSFLWPSVTPGAHQVFLEYRSQFNGQAISIDRFAVEVQHR
jgi:hypothetical protein